jgi:hypothetical protein
MVKKPVKKRSKRPTPRKDEAQSALAAVERLIGGKLALPRKRGRG